MKIIGNRYVIVVALQTLLMTVLWGGQEKLSRELRDRSHSNLRVAGQNAIWGSGRSWVRH